ncbi:MAG TPA: NUDIX hydrolase [Candidatus Saccharimonadales bacterium]|jgi:ADP-ribose pyrophosphatase YjhB (NUDIX family)
MSKIQQAGCVILDDYSRILLLHKAASEKTWWELPGGEVDEDEPAEQAAVQAIADELGIAVRLTKALGSGEFEDDENDYHYTWFQAVVIDADPVLHETAMYDDLAYFDTEDLLSLALAPGVQALFDKIMSGEVVLD